MSKKCLSSQIVIVQRIYNDQKSEPSIPALRLLAAQAVALRQRRQDKHRQQPHRERHQAACSGPQELPFLRQRRIGIPCRHSLFPYRHLQGCRRGTAPVDGGCVPPDTVL